MLMLGSGWWRVWHLLLLVAVLSFAAGLGLLWLAGADELGLPLVVVASAAGALLLMTLVDGLIWAVGTPGSSSAMRCLMRPALVVLGWLAALALLGLYLQFLPFLLVDSVAGPAVAAAVVLGLLALNLLALASFRSRRQRELRSQGPKGALSPHRRSVRPKKAMDRDPSSRMRVDERSPDGAYPRHGMAERFSRGFDVVDGGGIAWGGRGINPMVVTEILFIIGLLMTAVGAYVYPPLHDLPAGFDWVTFGAVLVVLLVAHAFLLTVRGLKLALFLLLYCFFLVPIALALAVGGTLTLNGWLDTSDPTYHVARVLGMRGVRNTTGPGEPYKLIKVESWREGESDPWIEVHERLYESVTPRGSVVGVLTKPGRFRIEWILEVEEANRAGRLNNE